MRSDETLSKTGLPPVPAIEIETRIEKFQRLIAAEALDGVFIFQNVDLFYFSGTLQRAILFVPAGGQPLLMVSKSYQRARSESPLASVLPLEGREAMVSLLADFGHDAPVRVGIELDVLPASQYIWLREKFPRTDFMDMSPAIRRLRMVKSSYEVEQIRRATAIVDKGYREIRKMIQEGMQALEIDGLLSYLARREGHMGVMRIRGWNQEMMNAHVFTGPDGAVVSCCETPANGCGITPAMPQGAGSGCVVRNQPIYIDYGVAVNGYHSDQTRTLVLGELDRKLAEAHACGEAILDRLEATVRPGVSCATIYETAKSMSRAAGLEDHFMGHGEGQVRFLGHGLGLEIDELPVMAPKFRLPVEEGMVFALEPKFSFPGLGIVGIEDDYLVTSNGLERLTLTEQKVIRID